jgi:hypothetical protein
VTYDLKPRSKKGHDSHERPAGLSMKSLFKTGLAKLPQVGFGLIMDMWRWKVFENEDAVTSWNSIWWSLNYEFLGISSPEGYQILGQDKLDPAGKFHIIDNVP